MSAIGLGQRGRMCSYTEAIREVHDVAVLFDPLEIELGSLILVCDVYEMTCSFKVRL